MPNIHFFGKSGSFAISLIGISLYIITDSIERDRTVAFKKSSSLSIMSWIPKYDFEVGRWNGMAGGSFSSSKWIALIYSFRSKESSFERKCETLSSRFPFASSRYVWSFWKRTEGSARDSAVQPKSSARTDFSEAESISLAIYPAITAANFSGSAIWREPLRKRKMVEVS